jgi:hypothetical protein
MVLKFGNVFIRNSLGIKLKKKYPLRNNVKINSNRREKKNAYLKCVVFYEYQNILLSWKTVAFSLINQ